MIFPRNKPVPVQYIIDFEWFATPIPKGIFPNIEKQYAALDIGCPATAAANNKLFDVLSPFSFDLTFGRDEFGDPYWRYEFDTAIHREAKPSLHDILPKMVTQSITGEKSIQIQLSVPYALVTDEKDASVMVSPPHNIKYENCSFVSGEFVFTDWIRHLASAWVLRDESKPAVVHFEVGKPCMSLHFNRQIRLDYTEMTETIRNYRDQINDAHYYRTHTVDSLFETVKSRRPKRLLTKV
jgi:hypothetical protein